MLLPSARHLSPPVSVVASALTTPRGGNLAEAPPASAFSFPSRPSYGAPCGVPLSRDARSVAGVGVVLRSANRAIRRGGAGVCSGSRPFSSVLFGEAAHQFGAHDANRNQTVAASTGMVTGCGGLVMRCPPLPSCRSKIDDLAHGLNSKGFSSRTVKPKRRSFAYVPKRLCQTGA